MTEIREVAEFISNLLEKEVEDKGRPDIPDPISYNWGYREALEYVLEFMEQEFDIYD